MSLRKSRSERIVHGLGEAEWIKLRERVKARDGYRCVVCGYRGTDGLGKALHADHIIPWEWSHDNSLGNLRTLCFRHHSMIGYRRTVNPFWIFNIFELQVEDEADRQLEVGFGVLRA